ncbi:MAG: S8 family peptidase [Desulfobacterales bacterium]
MTKTKKKFAIVIIAFFSFMPSLFWANDADPTNTGPKASNAPYASGEILVKYKPSLREATTEHYQTKLGITTIRSFHTIGVEHVRLPGEMTVAQAVKLFRNDPNVAYAEPNYYYHLDIIPNDKDFGLLWGMNNTGQNVNGTVGTADADIDAPEAWDITTGAGSVVVAVIDSGVDGSHPDLSGNLWTNPGEIPGNGVDDDGNGYVDDIRGWDFANKDNNPTDDNGHGTHVTGTIAAVGNNGIGVAGVAWNVKIMALKSFRADGSGLTSDAILAIAYANLMGADVINNSWGGGPYSQALFDMIRSSSAVVVCSAGNSGQNNDLIPHYPSSYTSANILAVAATDPNDNLAWFSNFGVTSVDVAAPGVNILSTVSGGGYDYKSGTSMAVPFATGLAALLKAKSQSSAISDNSSKSFVTGSGLSNLEIIAKIKETVDPVDSLNGQIATGGRINAFRAVKSTGGDGGNGGCFIATAAFGSVMEPHVTILRKFRDKFLMTNRLGNAFIRMYYTYSPNLADFIVTHDRLRAMVRLSLIPVVAISWVALKFGPIFSASFGVVSVCLIIFFFIGWLGKRRL